MRIGSNNLDALRPHFAIAAPMASSRPIVEREGVLDPRLAAIKMGQRGLS
jgi:hypothetical protein